MDSQLLEHIDTCAHMYNVLLIQYIHVYKQTYQRPTMHIQSSPHPSCGGVTMDYGQGDVRCRHNQRNPGSSCGDSGNNHCWAVKRGCYNNKPQGCCGTPVPYDRGAWNVTREDLEGEVSSYVAS